MASSEKKLVRQQWDKDCMTMAILAVREKKMGYLKAAKTFGVPKTTLIRLSQESKTPLKEVTNLKLGRKATLPPVLENELAEYALKMEASAFGLTRSDLKTLAYQLAEKNKLDHNFSKDKQSAGKTWLRLFLKRHPDLSYRRPTGTSIARLKGFNRENVDEFFKLLEEAMNKYHYTPNDIYNVDETGITLVPGKMPEILARKGKRQIAAITSAERGSTVTCVMCMNASGTFVPPMIIFPRKRDNQLLMRGAPPGAIHACHPSGWVQIDLFTKWFKHFIRFVKPTAECPVLLILDGHASHTRNIELIDLARTNHVQLLSLPPHSSQKIQPLDRTFMGPFKKYFTEVTRQWVNNNAKAATMFDIAELFSQAYIRAQRADLAINGFRVTGICPINRNVFQDHDFMDDGPIESNISSTAQLALANSDDSSNDNDKINPPAHSSHRTLDILDSNNAAEGDDSDQTFCEESEVNDEQCHFIVHENPESSNSPVVGPNKISQPNTTIAVQNLASLALAATLHLTELPTASLDQELCVEAKSRAMTDDKACEIGADSDKAVNLSAGPSTSSTYSPTRMTQNCSSSKDDEIEIFAGSSTSTSYISPIQLRPIPRLQKKSSNRGRKATKPTFLTSSPYKQDLEASIKRKEEKESLKRKKIFKKELEKQNEQQTTKKSGDKRKMKGKQNQKKTEQKKRKTTAKIYKPISNSEDEDGEFSVHDETDESPDRAQSENAKCFYCDGLFSEDIRGEQWIQCLSCKRWVHEECAGIDGVTYLCEFCH